MPSHRPRQSFGIICCSLVRGEPVRFLLVRKRMTYAFIDFVYLHIPDPRVPENRPKLQRALQAMTQEERIMILALNFNLLWWQTRLTPCEGPLYEHKKAIYARRFLHDGGELLTSMVLGCRATPDRYVWGFPKGRPMGKETQLSCALREFAEETGWTSQDIQIFPRVTRSLRYSDGGREYIDKGFVALSRHMWAPHLDLKNRMQINEIAEIRWLSIAELELLSPGSRVLEALHTIEARVRKKLRPHVGRHGVIDLAP